MNIRTQFWNENAKLIAESGMTFKEAAEEHGVTTETIRNQLARRGHRCVYERDQTPRQIAEGMRPYDAIEYLLGVIEILEDVKIPEADAIDDLGIHFTKIEKTFLRALLNAKGRLVGKSAILSAIYCGIHGRDEPEPRVLNIWAHKVRKKLKGTGWKITAIHGQGFCLEIGESPHE